MEREEKIRKCGKVLGDFLDVDVSNIVETRKFPHRYVFEYSAIDQPKRQIRYLFDRIVSKTWFLSIFFVMVYGSRFFDSSQCTRACRVWNGKDRSDISLTDATENWFEPADVYGRRIGWNTCKCYGKVRDEIIPLHPEISTEDQFGTMREEQYVVQMESLRMLTKDSKNQ